MKTIIPLILLPAFLCLVVAAPQAQAQGGCANFTTKAGCDALKSNTTGTGNTGLGWRALFSDTIGSFNTGVGAGALSLSDADSNTALGAAALLLNTTGTLNTAVGTDALVFNDSGSSNTANGANALFNNISGNFNTANGANALFDNITGSQNTAIGNSALSVNTADNNTAVGSSALASNTTGTGNIGLGVLAGSAVIDATSVIAIGADGENVSNSCYIGQIYSNIQPQVGVDPDLVTISSSGRLGRANVSSRRYKHDIQRMDKASEAIYALKPVSFRYNKQYDATQTLAFGLIAEEVAEVNPDLVGRNRAGQPESVRYEQINAMLLNEFLKEHQKVEEQDRKIQEQETTVAELKSELKTLVTTVNEQASQLQKVSAQLQINNATAQSIAESR
jgi:trimeric autotransporter adhesin